MKRELTGPGNRLNVLGKKMDVLKMTSYILTIQLERI